VGESRRITGYCPLGCGQTLFLASGGIPVCGSPACPRPSAVSDLLEDRETEHVVLFGEDVFTVRHPLRERLDDALMECALHEHIAGLDGPPLTPGRYRARTARGGWEWELMA
jgi:Family of unknown function (DUF6085)